MQKRLFAEFVGTFWLVFGGCGSAVLAAAFPQLGIGLLGVSIAFGASVVGMAYAVGHVSGGHFNPAVTLGLVAAGRHRREDAIPYVLAQVVGAVAASATLYAVASGKAGFDASQGFASNGFGDRSPGGYGLASAFVAELVLTALFVLVILGATDDRAPQGFAPIAIGITLTLVHLVGIPVTNLSVNPARSTGPAIFAGAAALGQLWLFWAAPLAGALVGGLAHRALFAAPKAA